MDNLDPLEYAAIVVPPPEYGVTAPPSDERIAPNPIDPKATIITPWRVYPRSAGVFAVSGGTVKHPHNAEDGVFVTGVDADDDVKVWLAVEFDASGGILSAVIESGDAGWTGYPEQQDGLHWWHPLAQIADGVVRQLESRHLRVLRECTMDASATLYWRLTAAEGLFV